MTSGPAGRVAVGALPGHRVGAPPVDHHPGHPRVVGERPAQPGVGAHRAAQGELAQRRRRRRELGHRGEQAARHLGGVAGVEVGEIVAVGHPVHHPRVLVLPPVVLVPLGEPDGRHALLREGQVVRAAGDPVPPEHDLHVQVLHPGRRRRGGGSGPTPAPPPSFSPPSASRSLRPASVSTAGTPSLKTRSDTSSRTPSCPSTLPTVSTLAMARTRDPLRGEAAGQVGRAVEPLLLPGHRHEVDRHRRPLPRHDPGHLQDRPPRRSRRRGPRGVGGGVHGVAGPAVVVGGQHDRLLGPAGVGAGQADAHVPDLDRPRDARRHRLGEGVLEDLEPGAGRPGQPLGDPRQPAAGRADAAGAGGGVGEGVAGPEPDERGHRRLEVGRIDGGEERVPGGRGRRSRRQRWGQGSTARSRSRGRARRRRQGRRDGGEAARRRAAARASMAGSAAVTPSGRR